MRWLLLTPVEKTLLEELKSRVLQFGVLKHSQVPPDFKLKKVASGFPGGIWQKVLQAEALLLGTVPVLNLAGGGRHTRCHRSTVVHSVGLCEARGKGSLGLHTLTRTTR